MNRVALIAFTVTSIALGGDFRIAALYPPETVGYINSTSGYEAICITKAAIAEAHKSGLGISGEIFKIDPYALAAVATVEKIVEGKFDAAVGTIISADAIPVSNALENAGIPFVVPLATNPRVTTGKKLVVRVPFNDLRQAQLLSRLAIGDLKAKRIAVVRNASAPYSDFLGTQFEKDIQALNASIAVKDFPIIDGFSDWKELVTGIMAFQPDLIFVPIYQAFIAAVYAELVPYQRPLVLLGSDTIEKKPQFLDLFAAKPSQIRFIFSNHWDEKLSGEFAKKYLSLNQRYCSQYPPSMPSAAAYDAIELLLAAIRKNPKARGEELVRTIRTLKFEGVMGPITYGADGDPIKPLFLFELRGGTVSYWKRYE